MNRGVFQLKDRHGNDLYFGNGGDHWFFLVPSIEDFRDHLKKIRHFDLRDGDVLIASYPRSGTFWHHQILTMLMNNTTDYIGHMNRDHLEWGPIESIPRPDRPWVYVTHLSRFPLVPRQVKEKKVKVIYCYRNPKDTWVSWYNLQYGSKEHAPFGPYQGTWPHFFHLMMDCGYYYGNWFDHVLNWEEATGDNPDLIFPSCYELMKKDPVGQIVKLDQFLGLNRGRALCEQIAEACQFSKLSAAKKAQDPQFHGDHLFREGFAGYYRKGEIGDWKNWFTVAQSEQLDAVFNKRMSGSKLPFFFQ